MNTGLEGLHMHCASEIVSSGPCPPDTIHADPGFAFKYSMAAFSRSSSIGLEYGAVPGNTALWLLPTYYARELFAILYVKKHDDPYHYRNDGQHYMWLCADPYAEQDQHDSHKHTEFVVKTKSLTAQEANE